MIFSIPISDNSDNNKPNKNKHITERIMDIVKLLDEEDLKLEISKLVNEIRAKQKVEYRRFDAHDPGPVTGPGNIHQ